MSGAPISMAAPGADQPNENTGPKILAVVTTITMIALVTVALRVWTLATTVWALVVLQVKNGAGRHAAYLEPEVMMRGLRANFATQPLTLIACTMPKVSVALFLLPIATRKLYRHFLWGLLGFMFVYTSVAVITSCLQCTDLRTFWDPQVPPNCWSMQARQTLSLVYTSLTIATDFTLAFVPIPMLWNVQINIRVKLSLIAIMSMGVFRDKEMHALHVFKRRRAHASFHSGQQKMTRSKTTVSSRALEDNISEEGVLPIPGVERGSGEYKITKTTVVTVDSVQSGANDEREQGLHSGQETDWPIR
ncbi:decarboxylase [Diplocarpon rosae]|nr:decarboxylase [Diplocarpon rosae]